MNRYGMAAAVSLGLLFVVGAQIFNDGRLTSAEEKNNGATLGLEEQHEDIQRLQAKAPDQAHAMVSVAYHFNNLWFAGQRGNWPLAQFYLNETRSHLRWAVRIIPVRKDNAGAEVKLANILQAIENSPLKQLEGAIQANNREQFVAAYEFTLTGCNSCHKASDKPFLRITVPDHPAEPMIDFSPLSREEDSLGGGPAAEQ